MHGTKVETRHQEEVSSGATEAEAPLTERPARARTDGAHAPTCGVCRHPTSVGSSAAQTLFSALGVPGLSVGSITVISEVSGIALATRPPAAARGTPLIAAEAPPTLS